MAVPLVFDKEDYNNHLCHLVENFLQVVGKHGIRMKETKELVKEVLYRVTKAQTVGECNAALQELRCYKLSSLHGWQTTSQSSGMNLSFRRKDGKE